MWANDAWERVSRRVESLREEMIALQGGLCAHPAMSPAVGGDGEVKKTAYLRGIVEALSPDHIAEVHAPDSRVSDGYRPTLVARWNGADASRTLWFLTHTDVVPPGEMNLWQSDPWKLVVHGDRIIGRGVEDNQQSLVASVFALKACRAEGVPFGLNVGLMFMADEENGSQYGMQHVIRETGYFKPGDLIVVPDGGSADGADIEIAEKGGLWVLFRTHGVQCHASVPARGINAFRAGSALAASLEGLYQDFPQSNPLFEPPTSTFEPTKKEANVPNVNTIPGEDVFYVDCRLLPEVPIKDVLARMRHYAELVEQRYKVTVDIDASKISESAPPTPGDAPIVGLYGKALRAVYGVEPRLVGIGGGTVGAFLRKVGMPCVVVGRNTFSAHQPNECCLVENLVGDSKVFAWVMGEAK